MTVNLQSEVENMREQLVAWRRDFHQHPELGLQEVRSAGIVAQHLRDLGYEVQTGIARTGVVGLLRGGRPGRVVMLRFDMDALPVQEVSGRPYGSRVPGCMHACGHDAHMAIGMGVAQVLAARRDELAGTFKLVFQPGEEGRNGALLMVQEGVLENPRPDVFLSGHVWNDLPTGTIAATPGPIMAAGDRWEATVQGKGGHGAAPHQTLDPVVAAAQIITALQTVVSRNVAPLDTAVVSVGCVHGGEAFNIIPAEVRLEGTIRTYNETVRALVLRRLEEIVLGVAAACGCSAGFDFSVLTLAVHNDPAVTAEAQRVIAESVGPEGLISGLRTMGSEDAAYFMREIPGAFLFFGSADAGRGLDAPHHNPAFDIDEGVLPIAVDVLVRMAVRVSE